MVLARVKPCKIMETFPPPPNECRFRWRTPVNKDSPRAGRVSIALTSALLLSAMILLTGFVRVSDAKKPQHSHQIHRRMSSSELKNVFQVDSHHHVPEYDLIHVRSIHRRDVSDPTTKEVHISAFGRKYALRLQKNEHLTRSADKLRMFVAEAHNDGNLNLTEVHAGDSKDIGEVYQDALTGAAVTLHHDKDGSLLLDGTIGSTLVIKPVPTSLRSQVQELFTVEPDDEMFLDNELLQSGGGSKRGDDHNKDAVTAVNVSMKPVSASTSSAAAWSNSSTTEGGGEVQYTAPVTTTEASTSSVPKHHESQGIHFVFKRPADPDNNTYSDYMLMEPDRPPIHSRQERSVRNKREAPEAVWPEILVIVDYDTYNMHGGNNIDIKRYFISFWNGVDLRYKLLAGPKVRVSLAGIIISKGRDATPYLENNRVGGNAVDSAGALTELGKYLFRERRLPIYDIAVVITKLDLCRREFSLAGCNKGTAGFAYVGGACVVNKRLEKVNSVAIIEDTGGFSGIIVAAHEVGHLLGAVHDGSPPPSYLGGPGAEHCRWEDGYIMSDLRHTERGFKWSICSVQQFKHFLNGDTARCLYNVPHEDEELPRLLPGKLLTLDAQCRKDRGTSACFKDDRVCAQLFCFDSRSGYCVSYRPAAEGSACGDGQFCLNGRCVSELENVIPDFSRISEAVVKKSGEVAVLPPHDEADMEGGEEGPAEDKPRRFVEENLETVPPSIAHQPRPTPEASHHGRAGSIGGGYLNGGIDDIRKLPSRRTSKLDTDQQVPRTQDLQRRISKIDSEEGETLDNVWSSTSLRPIITRTHRVNSIPNKDVGCMDVMHELAGGLSCKQFLRRYGDRYCNHHYIITNCCASRRLICEA